MWFLFSVVSAISNAGFAVGVKLLPRFGGMGIAVVTHVIAGILGLLLFFLVGLSLPLTADFIYPATMTVILNVIACIILFSAIANSAISVSLPFLSITPVLTALLAFVMRGEALSLLAVTGILMVVAGAFMIEAKNPRDFLLLGGGRVFREPGVLAVCLVAVIFGLSSVYDKDAMLASDPETFVSVSFMARGVIFAILLFFLASLRSRLASITGKEGMLFAVMGILLVAELLAQAEALTGAMVANVVAVKRLSMLVTTFTGFWFFREPFTHARLAGVVVMVVGSVVIYFGE